MVLRTARQGTRAGQQFYGCVRYPKCKGTQNRAAQSKTSPTKATKGSKPGNKSTKSANTASRSTTTDAFPETSGKVTTVKTVEPALRQKVKTAVEAWVESLVDFSRNNNLLFYKETKTTTLDLDRADPGLLAQLVGGEPVSLRDLFAGLDVLGPEGEALKREVNSRIKTIRSKAQENYEERSIATLCLVRGFATWKNPKEDDDGRPPNAPILIYGLEIKPGRRRDDLTLVTLGEPELNPVLQIFLKREFGVDVVMSEIGSGGSESDSVDQALGVLRAKWSGIPDLEILDKTVVSNFSYAKLSMVQDLESGLDGLASHPLVLALAGDQPSQDFVRDQVIDIDLGLPNSMQPVNEFLVLDADSSQNEVINAIVAGQSFAFEGPPGTGKSQTIANSVACLVAAGKKVLFVAEKRAAIDAVLRRLSSVGLAEMVMDFHGAGKKRREVLDELNQTLGSIATVVTSTADDTFQSLIDARAILLQHNDELFKVHQPWGVCLYDVLQTACSLNTDREVKFRIRQSDLGRMTPSVLQHLETRLSQFERNGGFDQSRGAELWRTSNLKSAEDAVQAISALRDLKAGGLDRYRRASEKAIEIVGVFPHNSAETSRFAQTLADIEDAQRTFGDEALSSEREILYSSVVQKKSMFSMRLAMVLSPAYRRAVKQVRTLLGKQLSLQEICSSIKQLQTLKTDWLEFLPNSSDVPAISRSTVLQELASSWLHLERVKEDLAGIAPLIPLLDTNPEIANQMLTDLLDAELVARGMCECSTLRKEFDEYGLTPLIAELQQSDTLGHSGEKLRWAWSHSLADHIRFSSAVLATLRSQDLDAAVATFRVDDSRHIQSKPQQIRRIWARNFKTVRSRYPKQEQSLLASINRKRKLPGLSSVFGDAPDLISALKPCWVMSPLSVSMLRPPTGWFDVVIFDEASQIPPADAITSIKAAKQMVVAGDSLQLPPTPFFAAGEIQTEDPYENEGYEEVSKSSDYESILDFVKIIIPRYRQLKWHYRSRDERLIAFSNYKLYKSLVAFPYAGMDTTLVHVSIPPSDRSKGKGASNPAEVAKVVQLVVEHAEKHPGESLGVIALGIKHSNAIEDALNSERIRNQSLDAFMNEEHENEPFFVKNLERVQGDERDAIILSIGYGRGEMGQIKYTFGPILGAKGERRLNVATTRAKLRMTSVAAFSSSDLDVSRSAQGGAGFLREYLAFVESGGTQLPDSGSTRVEMNPFEQSVYDQLTRKGVMLIPQYGVGNYRLDFAVQNPNKPGSFVLAIECDGRSYHSFPTARERDRLREAALRSRGWEFHRIWSDHWFANPEVEVQRALQAIERSLTAS